jgi:two-component system, OmpR family, alkaline phosphatase synthesis response regulator PhoP
MIKATRRSVLLVEDEASLVLALTDRLEAEGYVVTSVGDGDTGLATASSGAFDLVILDGMLPGRDGYDVCRTLRQRGVTTPILMLSARGQIVDRVVGLQLGADDYLTKPFDVSELLARIEALLRRSAPAGLHIYTFGEVTVNARAAEVTKGGAVVPLTAREFQLLTYLIEHRGATLSRDELLDAVWGYDNSVMTRTVDVHVGVLRQKLEDHPRKPRYILTVHGLGYKFTDSRA